MANAHKRIVRHFRLRKKVFGTSHRPRLSICFSNRHITVQVVDDIEGRTVASVSTTEAHLRATAKADVTNARKIGKLIAERGLAKNIRLVVFDRGGFKYHGKVKALAEAAREGGLQF